MELTRTDIGSDVLRHLTRRSNTFGVQYKKTGSLKGGGYSDQLSDYQLLKTYSPSWN
jgi:hypothetical protein